VTKTADDTVVDARMPLARQENELEKVVKQTNPSPRVLRMLIELARAE
jgi:hypothetical protein